MAINLSKGQKIDLTKDNQGLSALLVGLGWDEAQQKAGGFLSGLFGGGTPDIDCDASVLMLNKNGKLGSKHNLIYYSNLRSRDGSVVHTGDNLTGAGEGDDEQVIVDLKKIPADIEKLVFVVNIYDCVRRKQDFGMIRNAFIRVVDSKNNKELLRYDLSENYAGMTSLVVAEIYRRDNEWKFGAIGQPTNDTSLKDLVAKYQ